MVSSHELLKELLEDEEKQVLMEQMRKCSTTVNLNSKPLPSFYDVPSMPWLIYQHEFKNHRLLSFNLFCFLFVFCSWQQPPVSASVSLNNSSSSRWTLDRSDRLSLSSTGWPSDRTGGLTARSESLPPYFNTWDSLLGLSLGSPLTRIVSSAARKWLVYCWLSALYQERRYSCVCNHVNVWWTVHTVLYISKKWCELVICKISFVKFFHIYVVFL